ncbi:MAG: hypothetical protein AVDCRST_MAG87-761 [uncultured Thermomicrobiales bacterium]|uniref:YtxH domain-containing protein n=1 Tax=uncultured Thermomicrobiales bacterium TaxID=1645740 RepID=A0A6J4UHJ9_9BACT|nr:MAG: hypothetical protein AVDCRST_MAG87-761 [uncultured Thermomicrobiales bacterium]
MIGHARTAVKFFVYGLLAGLLFAPKKGDETRKDAIAWITSTVQETLGNVTGAVESVSSAASSSASSDTSGSDSGSGSQSGSTPSGAA